MRHSKAQDYRGCPRCIDLIANAEDVEMRKTLSMILETFHNASKPQWSLTN